MRAWPYTTASDIDETVGVWHVNLMLVHVIRRFLRASRSDLLISSVAKQTNAVYGFAGNIRDAEDVECFGELVHISLLQSSWSNLSSQLSAQGLAE
jgi:hypothetical protein